MRAAALLAAALLSAACGRGGGPAVSRSKPASPPMRQDEQALIARNQGLPPDDGLAAQYADLNDRHFGGKLPAVVVRWDAGLDEVRIPAAGGLKLEGLWGRADGPPVILLAERLKADPRRAAATLCHEMIHEYLDTLGQAGAGHGPPFQAQLKRLYDAGAFEALAPSEGEKEGLVSWLKEQGGRLEELDAQIKAQRGTLGARPSPQALADLDALVARRNILTGDYDREAQRYNAMLAYPDGLDETRMIAGLEEKR